MKLVFRRDYKSIKGLDQVELPNLTLVTGLNGTGKTHLLEAIVSGAVEVEGVPASESNIKYYNTRSFEPNLTQTIQLQPARHQISQLRDSYTKFKERAYQIIRSVLESPSAPKPPMSLEQAIKVYELWLKSGNETKSSLTDFENSIAQLINGILNPDRMDRGPNWFPNVELLETARKKGKSILGLDVEDIDWDSLPKVGYQLFQPQLGATFRLYGEIEAERKLRLFDSGLTKDQYKPKSAPPWEQFNEALKSAELPFEVPEPNDDLLRDAGYVPGLRRIGSQNTIPISELSSGEKTLALLALSVFQASEETATLIKPRILLLDEIDAFLHPAMIRNYLNILENLFVLNLKIAVIAITHSATTVALSPANSLFSLEGGLNERARRLININKSQALNLLTQGVPTIAINFDNRRQVFVEDETDAELCQNMFDRMKGKFVGERSLSFIGAGTKVPIENETGKTINGGCDIVRKIIDSLTGGGNNSVWGLIDYDKRNEPKGRLKVLGYKTRHSIENCLLDPRSILALFYLQEDCRKYLSELGLPGDKPASEFLTIPDDDIQTAIDRFCAKLHLDTSGERTRVDYLDAKSFDVSKDYLMVRGHDLENILLPQHFSALNFARGRGGLKNVVVSRVYREFSSLVQKEIYDRFNEILSEENH